MNEIEKAIEELKALRGICLYAEDGQQPPSAAIELAKVYDLAIFALEAQIAKKPVLSATQGMRYTDSYTCPSCGGNFTGTGIADYCYHCGQKLDWDND